MKNFIVGAIIIGIAIIIGFAICGGEKRIEYGAAPGSDYYETQYFHRGLVTGDDALSVGTTTMGAASTTGMTVRNLMEYGKFIFDTEGDGWVLYPPGSSTLSSVMPKVGQRRVVSLFNNCSSAICDITITATSGVYILSSYASTSLPVLSVGETVDMIIERASTTDFTVSFGNVYSQ